MTSFPPVSTDGHNSLQKSMIQYVNRRLEENVDIKKRKRFDYSDESVDFIKESLIKNDFNIKKVCNDFTKKYNHSINRSIVHRYSNKIRNNLPFNKIKGRPSIMNEDVQALTQKHLETIRKNSCPVNKTIALFILYLECFFYIF